MQSSVRPFMQHLIDYAGLFPPANLPLETSIRNYAAYCRDEENWMLGPFVIQAAKLDELDPYVALFSPETPLAICAIGRKNSEAADFSKGLQEDLQILEDFRTRHGDAVRLTVLEQPLPFVVPRDGLLHELQVKTARVGLKAFCEMTAPLDENWEQHAVETLDAIARHNRSGEGVLGFKLRTGGVIADAFPTPAQVAAAISGCRDRGIPMKFTAGLHHPIRQYRTEVGTYMHGFLNVFTAGIMAHAHNLDVWTVAEIVGEEDPKSFLFTDKELQWRSLSISQADIARIRKTALCSYGCCSFDEPRDDLRALEIL